MSFEFLTKRRGQVKCFRPCTYMVLIEHPETGTSKLCRISMRKKLFVNAQKAWFSQLAIWTIFPKAFVPFPNFALRDL